MNLQQIFNALRRKFSPSGGLGVEVLPALLVATVVFLSFLVGGFLTFWTSYSQEIRGAEKAVEAAVWKAAWEIGKLGGGLEHPTESLEHILTNIRAAESVVHSLELIRHQQDGLSVHVSSRSPEGGPILNRILLPKAILMGHAFGAAIDTGGHAVAAAALPGRGYAVAAAERPTFLVWLRAGRRGQAAFLGIAACASALAGILLFSSNRRYARAYHQLAEAEKRLRDVADAAGEYIWEVDADGHFTYLSDRVKEVLGWEPHELLGTHPFDLLVPGTRAGVEARSNAIVAAREVFRDFEHPMRRKDGSTIWISVNGVPVLNPQGKLVGYRGAGLDITSRKLFEQALVKEKEAAQAAAIAKSQFLAMMSHEIRTPLHSVLGYADLLAKSPLTSQQREHIDLIRSSSEGLLNLIEDILEISKSEILGASRIQPEPTNIRELAENTLGMHRPQAMLKGLGCSLEVGSDVPKTLLLEPARLRQILINLVGNAIKFTDRGEVRMEICRSPQAVGDGNFPLRIAVKDTGVGIPLEKRHLLFRPFSQLDSSPTRRHGGTGLGLVICRRLAEGLGGAVYLEESSSAGSTFVLECPFPVVSCPTPTPPKNSSAPGWPADWSPRILVVEDNPPSRKLLRAMLQSLGLQCEEAWNGKQAVASHYAHPFEMIFMDVQMPELDGLEATKTIREIEATGEIPRALIIALTADALSGDRERCLQAGMDDYLSKPLRREDLIHALQRARSHLALTAPATP